MKPKEKAEDIVLKYLRVDNDTKEWFNKALAKKCALIAVDEILNELDEDESDLNPKDEAAFEYVKEYIKWKIEFWQEVKQEIEKL